MKITAHCLVKNEERFVWYSVMSVIERVDKVILWDTGSEDSTFEIIKELGKTYQRKVNFRQVGEVTPEEYTKVRQKMLNETKSEWFLILDGDEVWWEESITEVTRLIRRYGEEIESIVNRYRNVVGDIYHYQEEEAGRYEIDSLRGHLTIRAVNRRIPGLYTARPHGQHGYFDKDNKLIQERSQEGRVYLPNPAFLHFTHVARSSSAALDKKVPKRAMKFKHELGIPFSYDFYYPEVFFRSRPFAVPSPWRRMTTTYKLKSLLLKPARLFKRKFLPTKIGY